jgi:hypothetical protein
MATLNRLRHTTSLSIKDQGVLVLMGRDDRTNESDEFEPDADNCAGESIFPFASTSESACRTKPSHFGSVIEPRENQRDKVPGYENC